MNQQVIFRTESATATIERPRKPKRRWDIYLFAPDCEPHLIELNVNTRAAKLSWLRWEPSEHDGAVLMLWPSGVPIPACWGNVVIVPDEA